MQNENAKNLVPEGSDIVEYVIQHLAEFRGNRVLVVDDNEINRDIMKSILQQQGILVDEAPDGSDAVYMVQSIIDKDEPNYYSAILMDIQMPKMNGYDATKAIRDIYAPGVRIPIVAITGDKTEESKNRAFDSGMDEYLVKPVDIVHLLAALMKHM